MTATDEIRWDIRPPESITTEPAPEPVVASDEAVAAEVPVEPHAPTFNYADYPVSYRVGAVPEALRPFMIEAAPTDYTPPFYVNRGGATRSSINPIPGCPPIAPGSKALVFDDWGNPKVIAVTGMHGGEIRGTLGDVPVQYRAWIAMKDEAPLTVPETVEAPARLTDEEADALDAELFEWSKFLGARAAKYNWCGTFENILNDVGVKPWRPGFNWVELQIDVRLDADDLDLAEKIGGESKVKTIIASTIVKITDVSREDYDNGRWKPLLEKAGYKNITGSIYVHNKEAMSL